MFNFFKKPAIGLDISDYSIEALELEKKMGKSYLGAYSRVELEKGIVEDGKILNKEKIEEKITELLKSAVPRKIKTNQVILSLPESKTFFHIFRLPVATHADLRGSKRGLTPIIEEEAKKIIPWNSDKIYFDFQVISKKDDFQEILYVGTSREIVEEYLEILRGAGLKPVVLDIESGSLARAFENEMMEDEGALIADIGGRITVLTVYDQDSIRFSATIPIAGNHFTQAISEKLGISLEKAEEIKRKCGLDPKKRDGKIMLILQGVLQDILNEIKRTASFYEGKSGRKIKKILLCGGSSFLPKLSDYIASNFGIETLVPDPWEGIDVEILFKEKELREIIETKLHPVYFATVIGLAKKGLERNPGKVGINLMPKG